MKKHVAFFAFVFITMVASTSFASQLAGDKKVTTHKNQNKSCCCCDMKSSKGNKKNDCSTMDSKKDASKKEPEAK